MAFDTDTGAYWCCKCGKELTIAPRESSEDVLVLKCQGLRLGAVGCGWTRNFDKVEEHECPPRREKRLELDAEAEDVYDEQG